MTDDDETQRLLRAADPARTLPTADPDRVAALLEETMSQPVNDPQRPNRSRWLLLGGAAAAAAVVVGVTIGVTRDGEDGPADIEPSVTLPTLSTTKLVAGPAVGAKCMAPTVEGAARQAVAFEGIVTEVVDGTVSLAPTHFYVGEETARVVITAPDPGMSEAPAEFVVGRSYVVGANAEGRVAICGLTGPAGDDIRSLYEEAFGG